MFKPAAILGLFVLTASAAYGEKAQAADSVSICDIVAEPQAFDGKPVSFSATVESDFTHFVLLTDSRCPERGLPIGHSRQAGAQDSPEFDLAMAHKRKSGGTVSARFSGVVSYVRDDFPHAEFNIVTTSDVLYRAP